MALVFKLVTICSIAVLTTAQLNYDDPKYVPEYQQTQSTYAVVQQLPKEENPVAEAFLSSLFQPPSPDAPRPFFLPEPSEDLKAPTKDAAVFAYDAPEFPPIPSEDLQLPSLEKWNPNNDPSLYYPTEIPTKLYPKKYNKDVSKVSLKVKAPLSDEEIAAKQKMVDKILFSLAKQENKKRLEEEKKFEQELQESQSYDEKA